MKFKKQEKFFYRYVGLVETGRVVKIKCTLHRSKNATTRLELGDSDWMDTIMCVCLTKKETLGHYSEKTIRNRAGRRKTHQRNAEGYCFIKKAGDFAKFEIDDSEFKKTYKEARTELLNNLRTNIRYYLRNQKANLLKAKKSSQILKKVQNSLFKT